MTVFQRLLLHWLAPSTTGLLRSQQAIRSPHCMQRAKLCAYSDRPPTTPERRWEIKPIGRVESSYPCKLDTPRQATILPKRTTDDGEVVQLKPATGRLVLFPGYEACLQELQAFDYIWVISWMHFNTGFRAQIHPNLMVKNDKVPNVVGLFSSRSPHRPNPVALSAVRVLAVDPIAGIVEVEALDLINDTPILDIKPYIPAYDAFPAARAGWMDEIADAATARTNGYMLPPLRGAREAKSRERMRQRQKELADTAATHSIDADVAQRELTGAPVR